MAKPFTSGDCNIFLAYIPRIMSSISSNYQKKYLTYSFVAQNQVQALQVVLATMVVSFLAQKVWTRWHGISALSIYASYGLLFSKYIVSLIQVHNQKI